MRGRRSRRRFMTSSGGWLRLWIWCLCWLGLWFWRVARSKSPRTRENTCRLRRKEVKEAAREIKPTKRAAGTLVYNLSLSTFTTAINSDRLEAVFSTTVLRCIQGDDEIIVGIVFSASTHSCIVQCEPGIVVSLLKVSRNTARAEL